MTGIAMVNLREQAGLQVCMPFVCFYLLVPAYSSLVFFFSFNALFLDIIEISNFWGWMAMSGTDQDLSALMKDNSGSRWGNKFGMALLPVYYHTYADPLQYLKRAKVMIDRKKQSLESHFSYKIGYLVMTCLGSKVKT